MAVIISHKYKFIFIKNGKTAGTSIEVFLSQLCANEDIFTPIFPEVELHQPRNFHGFYNRMPAHEIRSAVGAEIWNGYFKFCVERNPWEKTVSYYHMARSRSGGDLSMDQYLASGVLPINYPRYTEPGNPEKIIVDRVIRYEKLTNELNEVFGFLGIPFSGSLGVRAKSEYRTDRRPYSEVLTKTQAELIRNAYLPEILLFGYRYE